MDQPLDILTRHRRRHYIALTVAVGSCLVFLTLLFASAALLRESSRWMTHTHEVKGQLLAMLSAMQDVETGQRGYLLTRRDEFLEPYLNSLDRLETEAARLKELTADNPDQQARFPDLRKLITSKLAFSARTIDLAKTDVEAARTLVQSGVGKQEMDRLRRLIGEMETEEQRLLDRREDRLMMVEAMVVGIILVFGLMVTITLVLTLRNLHRDYREQVRRGQSLAEAVEQRDLLLQELNDRVKNSLQVVSSIVQIQRMGIRDPEVKAAFNAVSRRILAVAELHRHLYAQSGGVVARSFIEAVCDQVHPRAAMASGAPPLEIDADDLTLSARQAVAVGIIATEFISHAVPERGDTADGAPIVVSLRQVAQQRMRLEVSGSGFPPLQTGGFLTDEDMTTSDVESLVQN